MPYCHHHSTGWGAPARMSLDLGQGMTSRVLLGTLFATVASAGGAASLADDDPVLEEIVVRAEASVAASQGSIGSIGVVDAEAIELTRANHVHELLVRVPGVWISRGSGHEHLTAIRSGVLTGAGACGEFLLLENGIPIPSGRILQRQQPVRGEHRAGGRRRSRPGSGKRPVRRQCSARRDQRRYRHLCRRMARAVWKPVRTATPRHALRAVARVGTPAP